MAQTHENSLQKGSHHNKFKENGNFHITQFTFNIEHSVQKVTYSDIPFNIERSVQKVTYSDILFTSKIDQLSIISNSVSSTFEKVLSLCHKLAFSIFYIFATQLNRPQIFQTLNYKKLNKVSFQHQMCTPPGCKDIWNQKI